MKKKTNSPLSYIWKKCELVDLIARNNVNEREKASGWMKDAEKKLATDDEKEKWKKAASTRYRIVSYKF